MTRYQADFIAQYPEIPWEKMDWMRNRLSHGYFSIDFELVWRTLEHNLSKLQKKYKQFTIKQLGIGDLDYHLAKTYGQCP